MFALVCGVILLTACGGGNDAAIEDAGSVQVADVLHHASERLAATQSMRFDLRIDGETFVDPLNTMQLLSANGTMARPDRVDVEFQVRPLGVGNVTIRMITIGDRSWTTDLLTGKWGKAPEEFGYNPAILYDNQNGLGPVMGKLHDTAIVGTESLGGRETFHVTGAASNDVMDPLTSGTMTGAEIGVELWIDGETWDLLRIVLKEPESAEKSEHATWTMNLSDHDEQVSIEPPV